MCGNMYNSCIVDIAFKIAGGHAFKEAFLNANPRLLEPVQDLEVQVPEVLMGDIITDLQGRRSVILGMEGAGHYQVIKAKTPQVELYQYSTTLRSMTQGKGSFSNKFSGYSHVPQNIQDELLKAHSSATAHGE